MKKLIAIFLLATLALGAVACGNTNTGDNDTSAADDTTAAPDETTAAPAPTDTISGDILELVIGLNTGVMPEELMLDNVALDASLAGFVGLEEADYTTYVTEGALSMPMMMSQAHRVALLKCKDAEAALTVKDKIEAGFDPGTWVCVQAEKIYCGISGTYVYFVASNTDTANGLFAAFEALSGELAVQKFEFDTTPFMARG